jgi:hypothetical protein
MTLGQGGCFFNNIDSGSLSTVGFLFIISCLSCRKEVSLLVNVEEHYFYSGLIFAAFLSLVCHAEERSISTRVVVHHIYLFQLYQEKSRRMSNNSFDLTRSSGEGERSFNIHHIIPNNQNPIIHQSPYQCKRLLPYYPAIRLHQLLQAQALSTYQRQ